MNITNKLQTLNQLTRDLERSASALAMLALHSQHPSKVRQAAHEFMQTLELRNSIEFTELCK